MFFMATLVIITKTLRKQADNLAYGHKTSRWKSQDIQTSILFSTETKCTANATMKKHMGNFNIMNIIK